MKLFKNYVEVEQVMTAKESNIILPETASDAEKFEVTQKVVGKGPDCVSIEIGDKPIIAPHFQEYGRKLIEGSKEDGKLVFHVIFNEDDIVGVE